jgi:hypothetical protein
VWPTEDKTPSDSGDEFDLGRTLPPEVEFKRNELRLLAALAHCYRRKKAFSQLPSIPKAMADLIVDMGGLQVWLRNSVKRIDRFWKFVHAQDKSPPVFGKAEEAKEVDASLAKEAKFRRPRVLQDLSSPEHTPGSLHGIPKRKKPTSWRNPKINTATPGARSVQGGKISPR